MAREDAEETGRLHAEMPASLILRKFAHAVLATMSAYVQQDCHGQRTPSHYKHPLLLALTLFLPSLAPRSLTLGWKEFYKYPI